MTPHDSIERFWEGVRRGEIAAIVGTDVAPLPPTWSPVVLRVRCDGSPNELGSLNEARRRIEHYLGEESAGHAQRRLVSGLRRRLLGETQPLADEAFVLACERLAKHAAADCVLILDAVDGADPATLRLLERFVSRPREARPPTVLSFRSSAPDSPGARVLSALRAAGGAVIDAGGSVDSTPSGLDLRALPREALRVLRRAAFLGVEFDARFLGELLGEEVDYVLCRLQEAADFGITIEDHGDLSFRLAPEVVDVLRGSTLPSVALAWRARRRPPPVVTPEGPAIIEPPLAGSADVEQSGSTTGRNGAARATNGAACSASEACPRETGTAPARGAPASNGVSPAAAEVAPPSCPAPVSSGPATRDPARAVAERELASAQAAEQSGAFDVGIAAATRGLRVLGQAATAERRRLRIRLLCELGRLCWLGVGPGHDFSLASALAALEAAEALLTSGDPPELFSEVCLLIAHVCYDLGDARSLERALDELTRASRLLLQAGDAYAAARLLNDQAAVYVRLGDPVRAAFLLEESSKVFAERADRDPTALAEVGESAHLLARIPLHVAPRPGKEAEAIESALRHAGTAEGTARRLGDDRGVARVWETIGRLELLRGRYDRALERLAAAANAQESLGDTLGLARTTAAIADALELQGKHREALAVLGDSVRYNSQKGTPLGVALNRKSFEAACARSSLDGTTSEMAAHVARQLEAAESSLGSSARAGARPFVPSAYPK